jgi:hypothetical protein
VRGRFYSFTLTQFDTLRQPTDRFSASRRMKYVSLSGYFLSFSPYAHLKKWVKSRNDFNQQISFHFID